MPGKPTLLLDEQLLGLDEFLRDLGWNTVKVKQGMTDDSVVTIAKENRYVVISQDRKLLSRCRLQGIKVVDIGFENLARMVQQILTDDILEKP